MIPNDLFGIAASGWIGFGYIALKLAVTAMPLQKSRFWLKPRKFPFLENSFKLHRNACLSV